MKQELGHGPEFLLSVGGKGRKGARDASGMASDRKELEVFTNFVLEPGGHVFQLGGEVRAERALKAFVLNDGHRRVRIAAVRAVFQINRRDFLGMRGFMTQRDVFSDVCIVLAPKHGSDDKSRVAPCRKVTFEHACGQGAFASIGVLEHAKIVLNP